MNRLERIDKIIADHQVMLIDNMWVDVQSARAFRMVYDALNEENKVKYLKMPLVRAVNFAWSKVR